MHNKAFLLADWKQSFSIFHSPWCRAREVRTFLQGLKKMPELQEHQNRMQGECSCQCRWWFDRNSPEEKRLSSRVFLLRGATLVVVGKFFRPTLCHFDHLEYGLDTNLDTLIESFETMAAPLAGTCEKPCRQVAYLDQLGMRSKIRKKNVYYIIFNNVLPCETKSN